MCTGVAISYNKLLEEDCCSNINDEMVKHVLGEDYFPEMKAE